MAFTRNAAMSKLVPDVLGGYFWMPLHPKSGDPRLHIVPICLKTLLRIVVGNHDGHTTPKCQDKRDTDPSHEAQDRLERVEHLIVIAWSCHEADGSEVPVMVATADGIHVTSP